MSSKPRVQRKAEASGNIVRDSALGLVPETLDHYMALNRMLWEAGPLGPAELEIARLRNARKVGCVFCKSVRYDIARDDGLDEERVAMIEDDFRHSALSARDKAIIAFTDQYLNDPSGLCDPLRGEMLALFSHAERLHLSLAIAHFNGFSRCAVSLGGMPDELPVMEIALPQ
ncbi:MAG: carboxymuconolactone decarboxylase family protein [Halioglobus sp.]